MAAGTACRAWKRASGRSKAAVGHRMTRGIARKREVARDFYDGEQRRGATRVGSQAAWHDGEKTARLGGRWRWAGVARGLAQSSAGTAGAAHMARTAAAARGRENRGEGERGRRRRTQMQFAENTGTLL
jgi:hypothetical protein